MSDKVRMVLGNMPSYGSCSANDMLRAVAEARSGDRDISLLREIDNERPIGHQGVPFINFNSLNRIISSFRAAPDTDPAMVHAPVVVKALEWKAPEKATNWCWTAKSPLGVYSVVNEDGWYAAREPEGFWEWNGDQMTDTRDSAFRACEADYEQRIRSALSTSQSDPATADDTYQRILGAIEDFAALQSEDGEDWESWYRASFDSAREKIGILLKGRSGSAHPAPATAEDAHVCPVCLVPFVWSDTCGTDIELGICHAACLEGSPTVNLDTGETVDGPIPTFPYREDLEPEIAALKADADLFRRRYRALCDWYFRGGQRSEIFEHGHIIQTTQQHIDDWADSAAVAPKQEEKGT